MNEQIKTALQLCLFQFLSYGICTLSWRAVAQANIPMSVITDISFASINFLLFRKIAKEVDKPSFIPYLGYTFGGALGTVVGILISLHLLGK